VRTAPAVEPERSEEVGVELPPRRPGPHRRQPRSMQA
jgi:hypothetical protein